jgi:2-keto-4-pentenoate hydratase/2-oxohepta-3-ene-1,7-dioic acid hydratase in catechol pathway
MKLGTIAIASAIGPIVRIGVERPQGIVDATAARAAWHERRLPASAAERIAHAEVPPDMVELIASGDCAMEWIAEAVDTVMQAGTTHTSRGQRIVYSANEVRLLAPVPRPAGVANFSVWPAHTATGAAHGFNLSRAPEESGVKPYWKGNPDSYVGPDSTLEFPPYASELDVECELVCIVGTGGKDLGLEAAERAIAGYTIVNDASVRDIQREEMKTGRGPSKGKDFDTGNVMGPWLVTRDEIGDPRTLHLSLHINGKQVSESSGEGMVWSFPEMLAYLSMGQTVKPGQVISAGCYAGGSAMDLGIKLSPGDRVELRISKIGSLFSTIGQPPAKPWRSP